MPHSHRHHHAARGLFGSMGQWMNSAFGGSNYAEVDNGVGQADAINGDGGGGGPAVVIHTIYKTLAPTFEGPIAGYSTMNVDPNAKPTQAPAPAPAPSSPSPSNNASPTPSANIDESSSGLPSAINPPLTTSSFDSVLVTATKGPIPSSSSQSQHVGDQHVTPASALHAPSGTPTADPSNAPSDGDSGSAGAKAGIAFGVLGGVMIVGFIAFLLFNRRRRQEAAAQRHQEIDDEKFYQRDNPFETMTIRSNPHAPRISLRPVTQFLPNWSLDKRTSKGAAVALASTSAQGTQGQNRNSWERPATSQSEQHPANPFGSQAERLSEQTNAERHAPAPSNPFMADAAAVTGAAGAVVGNGSAPPGQLVRKTSRRQNHDVTVPGAPPLSPTGSGFNANAASSGPAAAQLNGANAMSAAGVPPNFNVHRVQLDFKPSLDDEMEMKAGELVRILHEYDDGWALVIRLDRSQQGVVPRTCLSTRPVKPRVSQAGPPQGATRLGVPIIPSDQYTVKGSEQSQRLGQRPTTPQGRPMTPQGGPVIPSGRPSTPQGGPMMPSGRSSTPQGRPMTPQGGHMMAQGRPMTPQGTPRGHAAPAGLGALDGARLRPMSPIGRSQSPVGVNRPMGGKPGPSPMHPAPSPPRGPPNGPPTGPVGRKPVPGQAY